MRQQASSNWKLLANPGEVTFVVYFNDKYAHGWRTPKWAFNALAEHMDLDRTEEVCRAAGNRSEKPNQTPSKFVSVAIAHLIRNQGAWDDDVCKAMLLTLARQHSDWSKIEKSSPDVIVLTLSVEGNALDIGLKAEHVKFAAA